MSRSTNAHPKEKYCALCDAIITAANDSREHLISQSIGGRKKINGFICVSCNSKSGETWDAALAVQLNPLSLLSKIKRERGNVPAQKFETVSGQQIVLNHDGKMDIPKPVFQQEIKDGKLVVNIQARSTQEAKQMIAGLNRKHPKLDMEQILKQLSVATSYLEDPLKMNFSFGGRDAGRSLVKSALALAVKNGIEAKECTEAINYLKNDSAEACFGFFYERSLILNRPQDQIFHCVAISNNKQTGQLLGYVEYYSAQRMVVCLCDSYSGPDVHDIYAIDPISGKEIDLQFDIKLSREDIAATYRYEKIPSGSMEKALDPLLTMAVQNDFDAARDRALSEAVEYAFKNCGAAEGEFLTDEHKKKIVSLMMEKLTPFLIRHMASASARTRKEGV